MSRNFNIKPKFEFCNGAKIEMSRKFNIESKFKNGAKFEMSQNCNIESKLQNGAKIWLLKRREIWNVTKLQYYLEIWILKIQYFFSDTFNAIYYFEYIDTRHKNTLRGCLQCSPLLWRRPSRCARLECQL